MTPEQERYWHETLEWLEGFKQTMDNAKRLPRDVRHASLTTLPAAIYSLRKALGIPDEAPRFPPPKYNTPY